jgi:hypothetical protein
VLTDKMIQNYQSGKYTDVIEAMKKLGLPPSEMKNFVLQQRKLREDARKKKQEQQSQ